MLTAKLTSIPVGQAKRFLGVPPSSKRVDHVTSYLQVQKLRVRASNSTMQTPQSLFYILIDMLYTSNPTASPVNVAA